MEKFSLFPVVCAFMLFKNLMRIKIKPESRLHCIEPYMYYYRVKGMNN